MPRRLIAVSVVVFASVAFLEAPPAYAQMDMLPQIFRDLPPELQQGLPEHMTYEEYRKLNRNVDFFTMFMSMFVPGYGMFQVERPDLGWTIAGARILGYGMMGFAVARQWRDWRDLRNLDGISVSKYERFKQNVFLFSGGIVINGLGWAFDVAGAYHIAKSDKDFVTYKYGIREGGATDRATGGTSVGATDRAEGERAYGGSEYEDIRYIRHLVLQDEPGEVQVRRELNGALRRYREQYPHGEYRAEVEYYQGSLLYSENRLPQALLHFTRQFYFFPDERYSPLSRQRALRIVQEHRREWSEDWELLLEMMESDDEPFASPRVEPESEEYARLVRAYLEGFQQLQDERFRRMFVEEALDIARREPGTAHAGDALFAAAEQLEALGEAERAVVVYTMFAGTYPDAAEWKDAMLRIGRMLDEVLNEPEYARRFYRRLVERYPDASQADVAGERLQSL